MTLIPHKREEGITEGNAEKINQETVRAKYREKKQL